MTSIRAASIEKAQVKPMKRSQNIPTSVAVLIIVVVLAIVGFIGYRYIWAPPRTGAPKVLGREFFQPAIPAQPTPQSGVSDVYGGARVVRPGSGN